MKCNCASEFQDALYGKGMRVFNEIGKDGKSGYRCATCGKESKDTPSKAPKK